MYIYCNVKFIDNIGCETIYDNP